MISTNDPAQALKLEELRAAIDEGIAALERRDYTQVEDEELDPSSMSLSSPHDGDLTPSGAM